MTGGNSLGAVCVEATIRRCTPQTCLPWVLRTGAKPAFTSPHCFITSGQCLCYLPSRKILSSIAHFHIVNVFSVKKRSLSHISILIFFPSKAFHSCCPRYKLSKASSVTGIDNGNILRGLISTFPLLMVKWLCGWINSNCLLSSLITGLGSLTNEHLSICIPSGQHNIIGT